MDLQCRQPVLLCWVAVAAVLSGSVSVRLPLAAAAPASVKLSGTSVLRRPVAIVKLKNRIFIGNRASGSVSILDSESLSVLDEFRISNQIDDLIAHPDHSQLLAVDSTSHELLQISTAGNSLHVTSRTVVADYPVSVVIIPTTKRIAVASRWSQQITLLTPDQQQQNSPRVQQTIDLPFAPLKQLVLDDRHILVADAFAGQLAVVDTQSGSLRSLRQVNGHNIRGLALADHGQQVLLTHQIMLSITATTRSRISWGGVVSNSLHTIPVKELLRLSPDGSSSAQTVYGQLFPLGEERNAAGDPYGVTATADGRTFVSLSGVHQVCLKRKHDLRLTRADTARRPTALLFDEDANRLFAVNTFDDSVSLLDGDLLTELKRIRLGPPTRRTPEQRGEELFHDARLSLDGWFSCHSCHSDGHTTGRLNDNFSDQSFGTPKRILTLLGAGDTHPWAWNGKADDLEQQVRHSIESTMAGSSDPAPANSSHRIRALTAFIRSLQPAPSLLEARGRLDRKSVERGRSVFQSHGCSRCHQPPTFSSPAAYDVSIHDETGQTQFNPPSLRGVSQRGPYFHDNRAGSLIELLTIHNHDEASRLQPSQRKDLLLFLNSL